MSLEKQFAMPGREPNVDAVALQGQNLDDFARWPGSSNAVGSLPLHGLVLNNSNNSTQHCLHPFFVGTDWDDDPLDTRNTLWVRAHFPGGPHSHRRHWRAQGWVAEVLVQGLLAAKPDDTYVVHVLVPIGCPCIPQWCEHTVHESRRTSVQVVEVDRRRSRERCTS